MDRLQRFWRWGFGLHLALVVLISVGAYAGALPGALLAIPHLDLLGHAVLIGGLAFFLDGALGYRPLLRGYAFPRLGPAIVIAVAAVEELAQGLSPRRTSCLSDFVADVVGVCLLAWLSRWVHERARGWLARA